MEKTYFHRGCNILRSWSVLAGKAFRDHLVQHPYFKVRTPILEGVTGGWDEPMVSETDKTFGVPPQFFPPSSLSFLHVVRI